MYCDSVSFNKLFLSLQQQLIYGRQNSEPKAIPNMSSLANEAVYARQLSTGAVSQSPQGLYGQLNKQQPKQQPPQQACA